MKILANLLLTSVLAVQVVHAQHDHHNVVPHTGVSDSATAQLLAEQIAALKVATAKYRDIAAAQRDGYVKFGKEERPLMGEHWFRQELVDAPLDLTRPSTLQYATIDGKRTLVGVAFTVYQKPGDSPPEGFAGSSDHWHTHDISKLTSAVTKGRPLIAFLARRRQSQRTPALAQGRTNLVMVHVWTEIENPSGIFANNHRALPYLQAGLPADFAKSGTENAAWGVALLQPESCDAEVRSTDALARLTPLQKSRLETACTVAQSTMLKLVKERPTAELLNSAADAAWSGYLTERGKLLTPAQKARLNSVVEHPMIGPG